MESRLHVELNENKLKELVFDYLQKALGDVDLKEEDVQIQVKSTQNYKSEWETAAFRAVVDTDL